MFLSNRFKFFLFTGFVALIFQACGSSAGDENKPVSLTVEKMTGFPFSTKEPEVYQGDFVVANDGHEEKWFMARKGDKWRLDLFQDGQQTYSKLKTDKQSDISHAQKIYTIGREYEVHGIDPLMEDMNSNFFWGKEYREFEDLGRESNLHRYRVKNPEPSKGEVLVYADETNGMVVRQEFSDRKMDSGANRGIPYIYEIRNLKFDVDDSVFQIPGGYRKVTPDEYQKLIHQKIDDRDKNRN